MKDVVRWALVVGLAALGACTDATAPEEVPVDTQIAIKLEPATSDVHQRLAAGISDSVVAQQVANDIAVLERIMEAGQGNRARDQIDMISAELSAYLQRSDGCDGPDISAIFLTLDAVARHLVCNGVQGVSTLGPVQCDDVQ